MRCAHFRLRERQRPRLHSPRGRAPDPAALAHSSGTDVPGPGARFARPLGHETRSGSLLPPPPPPGAARVLRVIRICSRLQGTPFEGGAGGVAAEPVEGHAAVELQAHQAELHHAHMKPARVDERQARRPSPQRPSQRGIRQARRPSPQRADNRGSGCWVSRRGAVMAETCPLSTEIDRSRLTSPATPRLPVATAVENRRARATRAHEAPRSASRALSGHRRRRGERTKKKAPRRPRGGDQGPTTWRLSPGIAALVPYPGP